MKNKKKAYIDTYESIYPVILVVANSAVKIEQLRKLYCEYDGTELYDDDMSERGGIVIKAIRKSDSKVVILVRMADEDKYYKDKNKRRMEFLSTIAHEAGHVVLDIYQRISEKNCTDSQEPFCYTLGWVFKCIYKTCFKK
jgi:hypothetical protein